MKRVIRANQSNVIFGNDLFELVTKQGVGMNNTPWKGFAVRSKGLAEKHVVEVRLIQAGNPDYNGEPIEHVYCGVEVAHGMRTKRDTLEETQEYIRVLETALDFAYTVENYLYENNYMV